MISVGKGGCGDEATVGAGERTVCFQRLGLDFRLVLEIIVEDTDVLPLEPVKVS